MSYASVIAADSPTAWWRLDESSGTAAADNTGNGNGGTYEGGFTLGAGSLLDTDADAAVTLNGTTGDVLIASVPALPTATSTISLEAWFKTTASSGSIIGCWNSVVAKQLIELGISGGQLILQVRDNNNVGLLNFTTTDLVLNDGVRHHVVATRNSSKVWTVYLDGVIVLVKSDTMTSACDSLDWSYIGRERRNAIFFNGTIDEVAIYNGTVLTAAQVLAHYQAGVNDPNSSSTDAYSSVIIGDSPVGYWRLDAASGILTPDLSGNGKHGALRNGATPNSTGLLPSTTDAAVAFDGTNDRVDLPADAITVAGTASPISIEMWAKITSSVSSRTLFSARRWALATTIIDLWVEGTNGKHAVQAVIRDSGSVIVGGVKVVDDGALHHIVVTLDTSKNIRIYVDGALDKGPTATGISAAFASLNATSIGEDRLDNPNTGGGHAGKSMIGTIDEVAVYNVALTATQVLNHFNAGYTASLPFIGSVTVVYPLSLPDVPLPFIASTTVVYPLTLSGYVAVPFIGSATVVHAPTLTGTSPDVDVPFIASKTRVFGIFSLFVDTMRSGVPGNGGESFPVELAPSGSSETATLAASITATSTLLNLTGDSGLPAGCFVVQIDDEVLYVAKIAAGSYRIRRRGMSNTAPDSHTAGADVTWADSYDMAIVAADDIAHEFTADITSTGSYTYPGWLICFDSSQAYLGADRYPMHVTSVLGVFDAGAGSGGSNRCDAAQPSSVSTPAGISDACPAALSVPSRIQADIAAGDVALARYTNPEASVLTLGPRSVSLESAFGMKRVDALDNDVTLTDPTGTIVDGSVNGEWDNPLGPGIAPSTGLPTSHDVPYTSVTLPGSDRDFTRTAEKGWPICALAVRQGTRRVPLWQSWDWHDFNYVYSGFDPDATFCQLLINRNGIVFGSVPEVELPGTQDIDGPDAVWDDGSYRFGASWYVAIYAGPYLVFGPSIGGSPPSIPPGGPIGYTPTVSFGGGTPTVTVPTVPDVEGGSGGDISPPAVGNRFSAALV